VGSAVRSVSGGKFAVLVDCDNIPYSKINVVFDTIRSLGGTAIDRRLYGHNFASGQLKGWNKAAAHWLLTHPLDKAHFDAEEIRLMYGDPLLLNLKEHY
jgi:hypothetical protein